MHEKKGWSRMPCKSCKEITLKCNECGNIKYTRTKYKPLNPRPLEDRK
jgi:ribosomal protein L33